MNTLTAIVIAALLGVAAACADEKHEHAPGSGLFGQPLEYVHVLLNLLPVYGLAIGALVLAPALLARNKPARVVALSIVILASTAVAVLTLALGIGANTGHLRLRAWRSQSPRPRMLGKTVAEVAIIWGLPHRNRRT